MKKIGKSDYQTRQVLGYRSESLNIQELRYSLENRRNDLKADEKAFGAERNSTHFCLVSKSMNLFISALLGPLHSLPVSIILAY